MKISAREAADSPLVIGLVLDSAEGAAFNSRGRKAVDPNIGLNEARRTGTICPPERNAV
jgi:hypothetical protein